MECLDSGLALPGELKSKVILGVVLIFLGLSFHGVVLSTDNWSVSNATSTDHRRSECDEEGCRSMSTSNKSAMAVFGGLHVLYPIGLLCLAAGIFMHLVGLVTGQWSVTDGNPTAYYSLWGLCVGLVCSEYTEEFRTGSLGVCQTFAVMGVVLGGVALISGVVFGLMSYLEKSPRKIVPFIAMIVAALAFVCILICVVTWAAGMPMRNQVRHEYSFALSIVGGLAIAAGGVLLFLGSN